MENEEVTEIKNLPFRYDSTEILWRLYWTLIEAFEVQLELFHVVNRLHRMHWWRNFHYNSAF